MIYSLHFLYVIITFGRKTESVDYKHATGVELNPSHYFWPSTFSHKRSGRVHLFDHAYEPIIKWSNLTLMWDPLPLSQAFGWPWTWHVTFYPGPGDLWLYEIWYFLRYELMSSDRRGQTESDAYEPTVPCAQVGSIKCRLMHQLQKATYGCNL